MPKISKQSVVELTKTPAFFESLRLQFGSYSAASKKLGIDRRRLSELADSSRKYGRKELSDASLSKLQTAIGKLTRTEYRTGKQFIYARDGMTPAQLRYATEYSKKSETGRRYFRKAVREYYEHKTKRVLMPALSPEGKFLPHKGKSPKMKNATPKYTRTGKRSSAIRRRRR